MYIPAFWCGVLATIIAEVTIVIVAAVIFAVKDGSKEAKQILNEKESVNTNESN